MPCFRVTRSVGVIVTNSDYGKTGMANLNETKEDRKRVREHFKQIGLDEVFEVADSLSEFEEVMLKIKAKARAAHDSKGEV